MMSTINTYLMECHPPSHIVVGQSSIYLGEETVGSKQWYCLRVHVYHFVHSYISLMQNLLSICAGCSAAIIAAISILFIAGELRAETNDRQLGCELSFMHNHAITISVRHMRASTRWFGSISLSVSGNSPSAIPRLNHSAVRVEMLSKIVIRECLSEELETVEMV